MQLTGKNLSRLAVAVLFCAAAGAAFADEAAERRLGDQAFYAGDYRNAAAFYESAMVLSDNAEHADAWAENALRLGRARFYDGDLEGAQKVLSEFRRRFPERSAGTLPGDLLAAAGKSAEAEKFYQTLIATGDTETVAAATMSRGYLRLRLGDFDGARACFESVAKKQSSWTANSRLEIIYTLIRQNRISPAMIELGKIPPAEQGGQWQLLRWYIDLHSGRVQEVEKPLMQFLAGQPSRPQPRICEILQYAAQQAFYRQKNSTAETLYERALDFAPDDTVRQEILRRLFNLYATDNLMRAKETAEIYAERFPNAPDRTAVLLAAGKLLAQKGKDKEALAFFRRVIDDRSFSIADRLRAAESGIVVAEKLKLRDESDRLYQMLISESPGVAARFQWRCAYIQYLLRINEVIRAAQTVEKALASAEKNEKETLLLLQLEAMRKGGTPEECRRTAQALLASSDPARVALARFVLAELFEKNENYAEARKNYLQAAVPGGDQERPARFKAALMALKCEETEKAAQEFSDFARLYPQAGSAPAALYYAVTALREQGSPEKAAALQRQLKEQYPASKARIAAEMVNCESRAENGDYAGAASDLAKIISELKGSPDLAEAMLMRIRFLLCSEQKDEVLNAALELVRTYPSAPSAAEGLLLAGNSEFDRGRYTSALQYYLQAEKIASDPFFKEVVSGKIIDAELFLFSSADSAKNADLQQRCQKLFTTSNNPLIRLQSRYKYGRAREWSGDAEGAVSAYEQLLYDAADLKKRGLPVSTEWCVRAVQAALPLIAGQNRPDALQRGECLIDQYEALNLPDSGENFSRLRRDFRKKSVHSTSRR